MIKLPLQLAGWSPPAGRGARGGGVSLCTQGIVLREVTGRSHPKSMRKQLCCSELYFCRAGSSEISQAIGIISVKDRGKKEPLLV